MEELERRLPWLAGSVGVAGHCYRLRHAQEVRWRRRRPWQEADAGAERQQQQLPSAVEVAEQGHWRLRRRRRC